MRSILRPWGYDRIPFEASPLMSTSPPIEVIPIPAFTDNYLWLLVRDGKAVVVDPGDAAPVEKALAERALELVAILVTHHHPDHIGGLPALLAHHPVPVHGPRAERRTIPQLTSELAEGDALDLLGRHFQVMEVPGHTSGHIAYYSPCTDLEPPILLCGDTLFSAGCGRLFEGTAAQLQASLARLATLPGATQVYCTHEYTLSNLAFANVVEPGNAPLAEYTERARALRAAGVPTLPSSIELELRINPFLRTDQPAVRRAAAGHAGHEPADAAETFAVLRRWKDGFRG